MIINNVNDLCRAWSCEVPAQLEKRVFKGTICGAWIHLLPGGVQFGSIVEGADVGTEVYTLDYPFPEGDMWSALEEIEMEADTLWYVWNVEGEDE